MVLIWGHWCILIIKNRICWFLIKDSTDGLGETSLIAEKEYSINFTEQNKKFCLSLYYNGVNSQIFVNGVDIYKFKSKNSEINLATLWLDNVLKWFSGGLYGSDCDCLGNYDSIGVGIILDIHICLMVKNNIK